MKWISVALIMGVTAMLSAPAHANSDDMKWVAKFVKDNADAKVPVETVTKYCTCMNNKMDDNETLSITQWEKSHPKEEAECDKDSGWK